MRHIQQTQYMVMETLMVTCNNDHSDGSDSNGDDDGNHNDDDGNIDAEE